MKKTEHTALKAAAFVICLAFNPFVHPATAEQITGLTTLNGLVRFDSATPGTILNNASISGLQAGESIVGIDFRLVNGQLYGLSSASRIYTIDPTTGLATFRVTLSTPLTTASSYGIDFNPVTDQLRIVHSDAQIDPQSNQNLRVDVATGAVTVDGALTPARVVSPLDPNIGAASYTNSFSGANSTTLYDIDFFRDRLVIQNPPNSGTLVRVGELAPLGTPPMGGDITDARLGFDISGLSGIAYASLTSPATNLSSLYTIDLTTGAATLVGSIGNGITLQGLAVPAGPSVPEPTTMVLFGIGMASLGTLGSLKRNRRTSHAVPDKA